MSKYKSVIFDLDGTLLNTLPDLMNSVNHVLEVNGQPLHTMEEIRRFVGNGIRKLMERATPDTIDADRFEKEFQEFQDYYQKHCMDETCLYEGIDRLLSLLKEKGIRTAIVSNKNDAAVQELYENYFLELIDSAHGIRPGMKTKPDPGIGTAAMKDIGAEKESTLYIGDSDVDAATAKNLGLDCVLVSWGFKDRDYLEEFLNREEAIMIADTVDDIIDLL